MKTINIATSVSSELRNRIRAHQIREIVCNASEQEVVLDFSEVKWIGRSFMDQFVEEILDNPPCKVDIVNMDELSQKMLEVVKKTHHNPIGSFVQSSSQQDIIPFVF